MIRVRVGARVAHGRYSRRRPRYFPGHCPAAALAIAGVLQDGIVDVFNIAVGKGYSVRHSGSDATIYGSIGSDCLAARGMESMDKR